MSALQASGVRRADHVGFSVASLDASLRFWMEGLGARLLRTGAMGGDFLADVTGARGAEVGVAILDLAGQTIELLEYSNVASPDTPAQPFHPGCAHLALEVGDLEGVLARIAPFGWRPQGTPQVIATGPRAGTTVVYATAPDGATIEFLQPPSRAVPSRS